MKRRSHFYTLLGCLLLSAALQPLAAQMGFAVEVKKPAPYENRVLKAEKTPTDKQIKQPKRFFQNMTTHYNYFFNANNRLNEVIERAKIAHKDDYSTLLPFYNYTLDVTAQEAQQLDSVIYKAQTGIINHDLRNDWIDNLYMLWGAAWFLEKKFDSAALMFQFINTAFAEKEKDGYYRYIGSRMDGNDAISVSTKESKSLLKKILSTPPSRNDAFIWQIRTQIEQGNLSEAGTLISTLKNDPGFPDRLREELHEVQAYWFYKQGMWDSSATHLVQALSQATTKQEKGRWEYLAAQLFELAGRGDRSQELYAKALGDGTDPVMDVYTRLNLVKTNKEGGEHYIDKNIADLVKMARRDKYEDYRDVIYYMAAQMELERGNLAAAQDFLLKAAKYNNGNLASRSNSFMQIADLAYGQKKYVQAAFYYDSVKTAELKPEDSARVAFRKPPLARVVDYSAVLARQDSLQRLAAMPEEERKALLTKMAKQLRKQQGLAEESGALTSGSRGPVAAPQQTDLFSNAAKGDWYFYNQGLKTSGAAQFKQVWGNRPNADNWRRFSALQAAGGVNRVASSQRDEIRNNGGADAGELESGPSYASLLRGLPLTPKALETSNDSIRQALLSLGLVFNNELEDYPSAIEVLERLRRMGEFPRMDEAVFQLYYAYTKSDNAAKAAEMKSLLASGFPASRFTAIATTGKDPNAKQKTANPQSTRDYEAVYDLFIEGKFDQALAAKQRADSLYRTNYWQPQLLYIEAVYHIRQRDDSTAKKLLQTIIAQDPAAPLAKKAENLISVLARRQKIEEELTALQINMPKDEQAQPAPAQPKPEPVKTEPAKQDTAKAIVQAPPPREKEKVIPPPAQDTAAYKPANRESVTLDARNRPVVNGPTVQKPLDTATRKAIAPAPKQAGSYSFDPAARYNVVIVLNKVDAIFSGEAKNAFNRFSREKFYTQPLGINTWDLDAENRLLLVGEFANAADAITYLQQAKRLAATEIVPWLKAEKYSFTIISSPNLPVLQDLRDLNAYRKFIETNLPGKL